MCIRDRRKDERNAVRGEARPGGRPGFESRDRPDTPRLGDAAFRAQRDALEHAQLALKKLAVQAHGEALTHLLNAWEKRDASLVPGTKELGHQITPTIRSAWVQALDPASSASIKAQDSKIALLRLEMASELPTPAEDLDARRSLQLQLLTRRNDPPPAQTWGQDVATVFSLSLIHI